MEHSDKSNLRTALKEGIIITFTNTLPLSMQEPDYG